MKDSYVELVCHQQYQHVDPAYFWGGNYIGAHVIVWL
jgi:hypothetical protein